MHSWTKTFSSSGGHCYLSAGGDRPPCTTGGWGRMDCEVITSFSHQGVSLLLCLFSLPGNWVWSYFHPTGVNAQFRLCAEIQLLFFFLRGCSYYYLNVATIRLQYEQSPSLKWPVCAGEDRHHIQHFCLQSERSFSLISWTTGSNLIRETKKYVGQTIKSTESYPLKSHHCKKRKSDILYICQGWTIPIAITLLTN